MYAAMAGGGFGAGRRQQRFDEYYRCYPFVMASTPMGERSDLNYGSKILLPPSALDKVSRLHVQWPIMLELINGEKDKHTHGGVLEFTAEEGRAYLPQWMMQTLGLDVGDMIQIKTTALELAKLVKLQPQSVNFLEISDPKAVLERVFRNFATITKGDVFNFEYNDEIFEMAVLDVKPETDKMGVCMIETDVSVDFAPPVGYVEPTPQSRKAAGSAASALPAGGVVHSQGTMSQAINYSAIAPSAAAARATNFQGEGQRLVVKGSISSTPKPATPVPAEVVGTRRTTGPMPLRLPPNKLFLGYEITPVKTKADKEREAEDARRPHFAGQGQTVRGVVVQRTSESEEQKEPENKPEEPKGRRLDGKPT